MASKELLISAEYGTKSSNYNILWREIVNKIDLPADNHKLPGARVFPDALPYIHGEQCGGTVENRR